MSNVRTLISPVDPHHDIPPEVARLALLLLPVVQYAAELVAAKMPRPVITKAPEPEPTGWVSAARLARAIGRSVPTVGRLVEEGMPVHHAGKTRRFDIAESRRWLDARGSKRTTAKAPSGNVSVDVGDVLARAGLKVVK